MTLLYLKLALIYDQTCEKHTNDLKQTPMKPPSAYIRVQDAASCIHDAKLTLQDAIHRPLKRLHTNQLCPCIHLIEKKYKSTAPSR